MSRFQDQGAGAGTLLVFGAVMAAGIFFELLQRGLMPYVMYFFVLPFCRVAERFRALSRALMTPSASPSPLALAVVNGTFKALGINDGLEPIRTHSIVAEGREPAQPEAESPTVTSVAPATSEVVATCVQEQTDRLARIERELTDVLALLERARHDNQELRSQLTDALSENPQTTVVSSSADVPAGRLHVVGRMIRGKDAGTSITVIAEDRPVRLVVVPGWDFPGETGTAIAAEAILGREGWKAWKVTVLNAEAATRLPMLDPKLIERETTPRKPKPEGADVPNLEDLDKDRAAAGDLRRHAHHVSAVSLHIVLVRHRRGKDVPLTDEMSGALKAEVRRAVEQDLGWQLVAANTGSTGNRNKHDHLHVAVSHVDVTEPIGAAIGRIKSLTSKRMRAKFPELTALEKFWSAGYYVGAFGGPNKEAVIAYVDNQEQ